MRSIALRFVLTMVVLLFVPLFGADLHWESDLQSAFDKAAQTNRPLMVIVERESCRWCKKMKQNTLQSDEISTRLKDYILVRVDKSDPLSSLLPDTELVPTIYFMTPKKEILESVVGYFGVLDFGSWIDDVEIKLKDRDSSKR